MAKRKDRGNVEGHCLLCKKLPTKKEKVIDLNKDFVCSTCTQYLLANPRSSGEEIEAVLERLGKNDETASSE